MNENAIFPRVRPVLMSHGFGGVFRYRVVLGECLGGRGAKGSRRLEEIRIFRDRMVGRLAYALNLSTGMFIVLFGHATSGCRLSVF